MKVYGVDLLDISRSAVDVEVEYFEPADLEICEEIKHNTRQFRLCPEKEKADESFFTYFMKQNVS